MGDDDQGGAGGPGGAGEDLHGLLGGQGVQGAGGLVGEEDPRPAHQGAGDGDPLGLPARQLGGQLVLVPVQAELGELGAGAGQGPAARGPGQQQGDGDVVQGGQVRQELAELEDEAELGQAQAGALGLVEAGDVAPGVVHAPGVGHQDPGQDVQEGGLARPGRAGDGQDLPGHDVQVDAAQGAGGAEGQGEAARPHDDSGLGAHGRTCSRSSVSRAAVRSIQRRSASRWNRA